jgi:hypothetical protein
MSRVDGNAAGSQIDKVLAQGRLLVSELNLLKGELKEFDPVRAKDRESRMIHDRIFSLEQRAWVISEKIRDILTNFDEAVDDFEANRSAIKIQRALPGAQLWLTRGGR